MPQNIPLLDLRALHATVADEVMSAVCRVIERQRFILGEEVAAFEQAVADLCGVAHAVGCASGTDALLLAYKTLDLQPADEVITSPFTFFATAGALANVGGTPVFVDIEPDTFNLDPAATRAAVTDRTRAIVPVHLFGQMAAMEAFHALATDHDLTLVEDAAQAIGSSRRIDGEWRRPGQLSAVATLSFFPSKNLGGWGDGGMIVTDDADRAARLRLLRAHGGAKQYHHDEVGTNSRLDTVQAAVLLAKLPHLEEWNARRRANAAWYDRALTAVDGVRPPVADPNNHHVYHQYTIRVTERDRLKTHLADRGIGSAVYYPVPLHLQPCFRHLGYRPGQCPEAERATTEVLSLPVGPTLTENQREAVVEAIAEFYR